METTYMYWVLIIQCQKHLNILTLILPTPRVIRLCRHYRARPAYTSDQLQVFIMISLKLLMDSDKNVGRIISFKKFGMIRVKGYRRKMLGERTENVYILIITSQQNKLGNHCVQLGSNSTQVFKQTPDHSNKSA